MVSTSFSRRISLHHVNGGGSRVAWWKTGSQPRLTLKNIAPCPKISFKNLQSWRNSDLLWKGLEEALFIWKALWQSYKRQVSAFTISYTVDNNKIIFERNYDQSGCNLEHHSKEEYLDRWLTVHEWNGLTTWYCKEEHKNNTDKILKTWDTVPREQWKLKALFKKHNVWKRNIKMMMFESKCKCVP